MNSRAWETGLNRPTADSGGAVSSPIRAYWPFLALVLLALILRAPTYGDPDTALDEQFYLLVGDRMLHGALPYVDIWDRKPVGLFLIYAAIRLLGGDGFIQYQVVAALFAGVTAAFIWLIARRMTGSFPAAIAGISYLLWTNIFAGGAGQSPIFYNALIAGAALLAFRSASCPDPDMVERRGALVMLLFGLVLQIKYTAAPEGLLFGLWFLWRLRSLGRNWSRIAASAIMFGLLGLAPTLAVTAIYAAIGHLDAFVFANFLSVFRRGYLGDAFMAEVFRFYLIAPAPLLLCAILGLKQHWRNIASKEIRSDGLANFILLTVWLTGAIAEFALIGNYYPHYFLPLLVPLAIATAPLFSRPPVAVGLLIAFGLWTRTISGYPDIPAHREGREKMAELTAAVRPYVKDRCLYVFDGPPALYLTSGTCLATPYIFPDHLNGDMERDAIGVDTSREMTRLLDSRPGAIVTASAPVIPKLNEATLQLLRARLRRDYVRVAAINNPKRTLYVYALKTLAPNRRSDAPEPYQGL